jgi:hypothetical protein
MYLVAKPIEPSKKVHFIHSPDRYILNNGCTTHVHDCLAWLQTLFILYMMLDEARWEAARKVAEKLAVRMDQLNSPKDAFFLADWTIQILRREAQK